MKTTIDKLGRVVVPKEIRDRLHLLGGEPLEVSERDGVVELRPTPATVRIRETADGPVIEAQEPLPALTDDVVRATQEHTRG
jgi:AbrB family looped-hinge helix DNA binding protein